MKTLKTRLLALALLGGLGCSGVAHALLFLGQTVNYQYFFPDLSTPYANADNGDDLVGPQTEVTNITDDLGTMDVSDTNLFVDFTFPGTTFFFSADFNGFRLSDANGTIDAFTSVTINPQTNMAGFDSSRISFNADQIFVNWQGLSFDTDTVVSLDVNGAPAQVPEPATLALAALALFGVGLARRKRKGIVAAD
jgi:hypothetical protein